MKETAKHIPKILVVDDEKIWFEFLKFLTSVDNIELNISYACNGQVAVDMLEEGEKLDAILMNIEMPWLDGLMATREIRKKDQTTPIIAWTCHDENYMGKNCKNAGMNDFIEKDGARLVADVVDSLRKLGIMV